MSQPSKVPIPPPPPALQIKNAKLSNDVAPNEVKIISLDECLWASQWPELQKACYLARVCPNAPPKECRYRIIDGQQQTGPTCGLTALSMLLNGDPSTDELLNTAQALKFTNNGELFSADYLYQLVLKYFRSKNGQDFNIQLHKGILNSEQIQKHLLENAIIFVP